MRNIKYLCLFVLVFSYTGTYAQSINGKWKGKLKQGQKTFYFEMNISETNKNKYKGTTFIKRKKEYGTLKIVGKLSNNQFTFRETSIKKQYRKSGRWCIKKGVLKYSTKNGISYLIGSWKAPGCYPGTIYLEKEIDKDLVLEFNNIETKDTVKPEIDKSNSFTIIKSEKSKVTIDKDKENTNEYEAHYYLGIVLFEEDRLDEAEKEFSKVIRLDSSIAKAYRYRGIVRRFQNNYPKSIEDLNYAIKLDSIDSELFYQRGLTYKESNDFLKAEKEFSIAIKLDSTFADYYFERGFVKGNNLKKYKEAIIDFNKCLKIDDSYVQAYYNRGLTHQILNNYYKAENDYTWALVLLKWQQFSLWAKVA